MLIELRSASGSGDAPGPKLLGGVHAFDGHHPTAASPDGSAGANAMRLALERAGIEAGAISAVKAHGTGSANNDLAEARALSRLSFNQIMNFATWHLRSCVPCWVHISSTLLLYCSAPAV